MRIARSIVARGMLLASVVILTGCVSEPTYPPGMTQAEADAILASQVAAQRSHVEALFPDAEQPDFVVIHDHDKYQDAMNECLEESGAIPLLAGDPSGIPVVERTALELALALCSLENQLDPFAMGFRSQAQLDYLYEYFTTKALPCMELMGLEAPEPPTKEQFVSEGGWWSPFELFYSLPPEDAQLFEFRCPTLPAEVFPEYQL